jgi:hypothetical protein
MADVERPTRMDHALTRDETWSGLLHNIHCYECSRGAARDQEVNDDEKGKRPVAPLQSRVGFRKRSFANVVDKAKTHDLRVCENPLDIQWQKVLRGRDREHLEVFEGVQGTRGV